MTTGELTLTAGQLTRRRVFPAAVAVAAGPMRAGGAGGLMPAETRLRGESRRNESMARHVSWRAGGVADHAYVPADLDDLRIFMATLPQSEPVCFVGLGSNLLVRDGGYRGTVIFTHRALGHLRLEEKDTAEIHAEAGVASPKVARFAALHAFGGAEFLAGIPGTVGGALAMNAGCYGGETWEIVARVTVLDRGGRLRERTRDDYSIHYRSVTLKAQPDAKAVRSSPRSAQIPEEWFVAAAFSLPRGDGAESRRKIRELLTRRIATQPLSQPNAGSVFRNPPGEYAARLIEACGLKGCAIGGAVISPKHANFIVNTGQAQAADIEALIQRAQAAVRARFGIELEREVRIIGEASSGGAGP